MTLNLQDGVAVSAVVYGPGVTSGLPTTDWLTQTGTIDGSTSSWPSGNPHLQAASAAGWDLFPNDAAVPALTLCTIDGGDPSRVLITAAGVYSLTASVVSAIATDVSHTAGGSIRGYVAFHDDSNGPGLYFQQKIFYALPADSTENLYISSSVPPLSLPAGTVVQVLAGVTVTQGAVTQVRIANSSLAITRWA